MNERMNECMNSMNDIVKRRGKKHDVEDYMKD